MAPIRPSVIQRPANSTKRTSSVFRNEINGSLVGHPTAPCDPAQHRSRLRRARSFPREGAPDRVHPAFRRVASGRAVAAWRGGTLHKAAGAVVELHLAAPPAGPARQHDGAGVSVDWACCAGRRLAGFNARGLRKLVKCKPCDSRRQDHGVGHEPGNPAVLAAMVRLHGRSPQAPLARCALSLALMFKWPITSMRGRAHKNLRLVKAILTGGHARRARVRPIPCSGPLIPCSPGKNPCSPPINSLLRNSRECAATRWNCSKNNAKQCQNGRKC
jgi:hypothetical protein